MAIGFARVGIVHAGPGSSAVGLSAYVDREARLDAASGQKFDFRGKKEDHVASGVLLPAGAAEACRDPQRLWDAAEAAELTVDRESGEARFKKNAQLAKHMVLALPADAEISDADRLQMVERFVAEQFTAKGVAVHYAIHRPHAGGDNHHAHLLVTTRVLGEEGFGNKARHLNPGFVVTADGRRVINEQDHWERRWTEFQNRTFQEMGLALRVDPARLVPEQTMGRGGHFAGSDARQRVNEARDEARALVRDPEQALAALTRHQAMFSERDVDRLFAKHGITGEEQATLKRQVLEHGTVLRLYDRDHQEATGYFTTTTVRRQEQACLAAAATVEGRHHRLGHRLLDQVAQRHDLDSEQVAVYRRATGTAGLALIEGIAGGGKSRAVAPIREAYAQGGYRVIGLAPTNTVAQDMRRDGFAEASTLHLELKRLDEGRSAWTRKTAVIVDEAAMVDTRIYERLLTAAARSGAKLVLVGDDRQLASVERGGMFTVLKEAYGAAAISQVRWQDQSWARQASQDFTAGRVAAGLEAYQAQGCVHWAPDLDQARRQLAERWAADDQARPDKVRFVYASTNREVERLNQELRAIRLERGAVADGEEFTTVRGKIRLAEGDRLQFYGNDRQAGIFNGVLGTVESVRRNSITVLKDDGQWVRFNPESFREFGHGYAGTVYRGQGKTQPEVYALYDNAFAWNARTAYVGMTRHREEVHLFVPKDLARDLPALARQMGRQDQKGASLAYAEAAEIVDLRQRRVAQMQAEVDGQRRRFDGLWQRLERIGAKLGIGREPSADSTNDSWRRLDLSSATKEVTRAAWSGLRLESSAPLPPRLQTQVETDIAVYKQSLRKLQDLEKQRLMILPSERDAHAHMFNKLYKDCRQWLRSEPERAWKIIGSQTEGVWGDGSDLKTALARKLIKDPALRPQLAKAEPELVQRIQQEQTMAVSMRRGMRL